MENSIVINEIPQDNISNIENVIIENQTNCSLNFDKIYEYKDVIAISLLYIFKQLL